MTGEREGENLVIFVLLLLLPLLVLLQERTRGRVTIALDAMAQVVVRTSLGRDSLLERRDRPYGSGGR